MRLQKVVCCRLSLFLAGGLFLVFSIGGTAYAAEDAINAKLATKESTEAKNPWGYRLHVEPKPKKRITFRDLKDGLDNDDFVASLKALDMALNEVGDGSTFVWRRKNNKLKGAIKPTSAFRSTDGRVCRHLVFSLYLHGYVKSIESIACRKPDGRWVLDG